uniref:Uncharacterized protein n=1 Tax=Arundo donax TaxID=35708 RepID=A0A0A9ATK6_ARUDO
MDSLGHHSNSFSIQIKGGGELAILWKGFFFSLVSVLGDS